MHSPLDLLLPYQRRWVDDDSRFKIWLASRQIGKSFTSACEAVRDCHLHPRSLWVVLSAGERQALEWMEKAKQWAEAFGTALEYAELRQGDATFKSASIRFPNKSRLLALPANPDTARGYSAHIILDEFAIHRDGWEIWRAMLPSITNPLRGALKVRVMSTPKGEGNAFHALWMKPEWARHKTTIEDAKAGGLDVDLAALRAMCADEDMWRQEYLCEFIDSQRSAFPYELISRCETEEASLIWPEHHTPTGALYTGIDIGSIHDPTVCVTYEEMGPRLVLRERLVLRGIELSRQDELLAPSIRRATRVGIDASGLGLDISQRLRRTHGGKIHPQATTATWKRQAFARVQTRMADAELGLPPDRDLREEFHNYQVSGAGESARYFAPRAEDHHSDTVSATAHALDVAVQKPRTGFTRETLSQTILGRHFRRLISP